jgi:hypothetical protein
VLLFLATAGLQGQSASHWIEFLKYEVDRPHRDFLRLGLFGCGSVVADREAAIALAALGKEALPALERELDIADSQDAAGFSVNWLQLAYASIKGREALPRLRRMERPAKGTKRRHLDAPIALALSLTSYVSDTTPLVRNIRCSRGSEPRDPLDRLILGWIRGDRSWLEQTLGPAANRAWNALLKNGSWETVRSRLWLTGPEATVAVGYRFDIRGRWSASPETLRAESLEDTNLANTAAPRFDLDTMFVDRSGVECGRRRLTFIARQRTPHSQSYLLDSLDESLLRLISQCAARQ